MGMISKDAVATSRWSGPLRGVSVVAGPPARMYAVAAELLSRGVSPQLAAGHGQLLDVLDMHGHDAVVVDLAAAGPDPRTALDEITSRCRPAPVVAVLDSVGQAGRDDVCVVPSSTPPGQVAAIAVDAMAAPARTAATYTYGALTLDVRMHEACWEGVDVGLTRSEFVLLTRLMQAAGAVVARGELAAALYRGSSPGDVEALRAHVTRMRRRVGVVSGEGGRIIGTVSGVGYRMVLPSPAPPVEL